MGVGSEAVLTMPIEAYSDLGCDVREQERLIHSFLLSKLISSMYFVQTHLSHL